VTQMPRADRIAWSGDELEELEGREGSAAGVAEAGPEDSETVGGGIREWAQKYGVHES